MNDLDILRSKYMELVELSKSNKVPCYVASVVIGLTPVTYLTALSLLGEEEGDDKILMTLRQSDFAQYVSLINAPEENEVQLKLFEPLFLFPENANSEVTTFKVIFTESAEKETPKSINI